MIQQGIDAIRNAITANIATSLAAMPGSVFSGAPSVVVTRNVLDESQVIATPIGVRVEQQDAVTFDWPMEAAESAAYPLALGVTCWLSRTLIPTLASATDDTMIAAVRGLARAVDHAIRTQFAPMGALLVDGVQVRCPSQVTLNEPEQGEDGNLTVMTLSLTVPVFDSWALSAGSL